jgi:hypothetical protein
LGWEAHVVNLLRKSCFLTSYHSTQISEYRALPIPARFSSSKAKPTLKQETRNAILLAIAKARSWTDDLVSGCVQSFDEIAEREGKVERHIRLLTPLAFIPPRTLAAIVAGTGPRDANVTALAQAISMGAQSCRPNFRASARRRPLMVVRGS